MRAGDGGCDEAAAFAGAAALAEAATALGARVLRITGLGRADAAALGGGGEFFFALVRFLATMNPFPWLRLPKPTAISSPRRPRGQFDRLESVKAVAHNYGEGWVWFMWQAARIRMNEN